MPSHIKNYQAKKNGTKKTIRQRRPQAVLELVEDWRKDLTTIAVMMAQLKFWSFNQNLPLEFRLAASREYMDRVLGKPKQEMDVTFSASDDILDLYKRSLRMEKDWDVIDVQAIHEAMKALPARTLRNSISTM